MITARGQDEWAQLVDNAKTRGTFRIQLHCKIRGQDGIERDEGVWLFDNHANRIESESYPFKSLSLQERIRIVDEARQYTIRQFRLALSKAQQEKKLDGAQTLINTWEQALSLLDLDPTVRGSVGLSTSSEIEDGVCTSFLVVEQSAMRVDDADFLSLSRESRIVLLQTATKIADNRFNRAITILKNWKHLVEVSRQ